MSLSPFFDTIIFIQTPCHSPPLTSRAKGGSKPTYSPLFILMWKKCSADLIYTEMTKIPLSSCWIFEHISITYMTLWTSYHQRLILTSKIHPSEFTYETQVPNQVGLHISTQLPNQVGLQIWQVLTWLNITNFTSWVSTWPFHQTTNMTLHDQGLKKDNIFQNHHNANKALYSATLMLPLKLCIQASFSYD